MGVWNSNDFLTRILYKFRITFWMILYHCTLPIYFSLQFLKLDFISLKTQFLYNFYIFFFTFSLAFISLQFLKLAFISLWFLFLYNSNATHLPKILVCVNIGVFWCYFLIISSSQCNWYNWMIHGIKEFFCNIIFADWVFKCQIKVIILIHFFPTIAFFRSWTLQWPTFSIYININMFL